LSTPSSLPTQRTTDWTLVEDRVDASWSLHRLDAECTRAFPMVRPDREWCCCHVFCGPVTAEQQDLLAHLGDVRIHFSVVRKLPSSAQRTTLAHPEAGDGPVEIAASDILSALDRVRHSRTVGSSQRLIQFLTFIIEAALNGDHLKETTIGVSVFGCTPDYDPKTDAIVRSQAWRLRLKLREYYASEGAGDPLIIDVPKGHYVPAFSLRNVRAIGESASSNVQRPHLRRA
jgi:hypothetical protein